LVGWAAIAVGLAGFIAGCSNEKSDAPETPSQSAEQPAETPEPKPKPKPSRRTQLEPWRPLLEEVSRAEMDIGGTFIDFGDAATHKWVRGGWKNAWGGNRRDDDGTTYTEINGSKVEAPVIIWQDDDPVKEVVVRLRGKCGGQKIAARFDGEDVGSAELTKDEWKTLRMPVSEPPEAGWREFGLLVRGSCGDTRAELDWVWLSDEAGAEPPEILDMRAPLTIGDGQPKRALPAPDARTYAWYLTVPEKAELVFDYASASPETEFIVSARVDGQPKKTIFSEKGGEEWKEGVADLSQFAGEAIRLELTTAGPDTEAGWGEVAMMVPPRDIPEPSGERRPPRNVVVILIDTVRADVFEPIGGKGSEVQTPSFDALTKESTVFTAAYDNENWTKPSCATVLTGLYPTSHDTKKDSSTLPGDVDMISEILKAEGFATGSFIANGYVSEKYGFNQGWDFHRNYIRESRNTSAENVYDEAIEWFQEHKEKPFFMYLQTIDPHVPYRVDRKYTELYFPENPPHPPGSNLGGREQQKLSTKDLDEKTVDWIKALYYGEVTYHDEHMGRFIDALRKEGALDDTLLIITNDHGEELKEHGRLGHGHTLHEELVHAPLLMRYPGRFPAKHQVHEPVELVDLVPTILDVLDQEPSDEVDGITLMPLVEGSPLQRPFYAISEFLYGQRSVRVGRYKMIRAGNWVKLFDLEEDPTEQNDISETALIGRRLASIHLAEGLANPDKRRRMLDNRVAGKKFDAGVVEMDPELKKQLEALGYFGDE
jgi:arylsulfatase A-like enzyme